MISVNSLKSVVWRYGMAIGIFALTVVVHLRFKQGIGEEFFLLLNPGVFLAALFGGFGPGLLATGLAAVFAAYFYLPPAQSIYVEPGNHLLALVIFCVSGILFSVLSGVFHKSRKAATHAFSEAMKDYWQRRKSESELIESQRVAHLGSWSWDIKSDAVFWSEELFRIFQRDPSLPAPSYQEHPDLYTADSMRRLDEVVAKAQRDGTPYEVELQFIKKDKSIGWMLARGEAVRGPGNELVGLRGIAQDISAMKAAEEKLRASEEEARRANRIKDEFLSTLSHELRTPLTTILGWSQEVLEKSMDPEIVKEGVSVIERSAKAQGQLIDDLLDVTRIKSGKMALDIRLIDLVEVVHLAIASVRIPAEKKSVKIIPLMSTNTCQVFADTMRMQQVFWNLLTNAIKFTPCGGTIVVRLDVTAGKTVQVQVKDSGLGIKPEFLKHIFERFNQADSSTTRTYGGLGLGLSIVKSLVEMQNGIVKVESEGEGKGATFTIELPLVNQVSSIEDTPLADRIKAKEAGLQAVKVLVVDDSEDNLRLFSVMLKSFGAEVRIANSAQDGLQRLIDFAPDILLSDISMPQEDGYSFIRKVRALSVAQGGKTPAIALTAYAASDDAQKAVEAGFAAHVAKPVDKLKLFTTIKNLVKSQNYKTV